MPCSHHTSWHEAPSPGVVTIPVGGTKKRTIGLAVGTRELPPAVERLHQHIIAHAQRVLGRIDES